MKKGVDNSAKVVYYIKRRLTNTDGGTGNRGVAQSGSARALGAWGRGFESLHPDQQRHPAMEKAWLLGQAVKTPPFHGGYGSSNLPGVTNLKIS